MTKWSRASGLGPIYRMAEFAKKSNRTFASSYSKINLDRAQRPQPENLFFSLGPTNFDQYISFRDNFHLDSLLCNRVKYTNLR